MSLIRGILTVGLLLLSSQAGMAHDLKVMPSRSTVERGDKGEISISWGHKLPFDTPLDAAALDRYELKSPSGSLMPLQASGLTQHTNAASFEEEGVYQAIATRKPSIFTVVIDQAGQHKHHRGPKSSVNPEDGQIDYGALSYQYAKSLITSGKRSNRPVPAQGLPLEIVPLEAPADWQAHRDLHFQVLLEGQPVVGEEVVVSVLGLQPTADAITDTDTDAGGFVNPTLLTNDQGIVEVKTVPPGTWVLRQRVKKPVQNADLKKQYDYESHTSTLVLEVLP